MYLNILEYIDEEKQEELMEMIGLAEKIKGVIAQIEKNGEKNGERNIINRLIENFTSEDDTEKIIISKATLLNMMQK